MWQKKVARLFFRVIIATLLFEGVCRLACTIDKVRYTFFLHEDRKAGHIVYDPYVGWCNAKKFSGQTKWPHRITVEETNLSGWRDREFESHKPADLFRIVALGCSMTYGYGVNSEETYPKVIERLFHRETGHTKRIEVLNCGVNGYGLDQMILAYDRYIREYHPDMVILQLLSFNITRSFDPRPFGWEKPSYKIVNGNLALQNYPVRDSRLRIANTWLQEKSRFYKLVRNVIRKVRRLTKRTHPSLSGDHRDLVVLMLRHLASLVEQNKATLIIFTWGDKDIVQLCRDAGVEAIDINDYSDDDRAMRQSKDSLYNPPPVRHWSPHGHEYVATALYRYLSLKYTMENGNRIK